MRPAQRVGKESSLLNYINGGISMKQPLFAHLHSHTEYSLLDGSNRIRDYLDRVKELGMESAAITDHGVMYGVVDFYKYAKEIGIHPVIGCEVYVAPQGMTDPLHSATTIWCSLRRTTPVTGTCAG